MGEFQTTGGCGGATGAGAGLLQVGSAVAAATAG
jgi:hypothetical protein